ncbi:single-stranded-DNA-specific exonuclease RecJ [Flavobacterium sp. CBA20B-1]|uniref:single-stranded-DNA-specific exonuclease RecJ n=1 Tax=unclassified Flavobacterium TaxID=196869 RepID=UPI0022258162|nr:MULTISPECIES: single-stranded-DNA-specific exonuclease RecJ [unclassified Flavobacterium]WCM41493.1 single-stranded-DNA-specific exonuclease RecJ [Flavobacterium sp. CBA20B-1]
MRWSLKQNPDSQIIQHLKSTLNVSALIATLLTQRGVDSFEKAKKFFRPNLADLYNPYLMKDMDKAVERIEKAIATNERILVFGDYDVDGTTAVALMSSYLKSFYPDVDTYIPDRYAEGYGISNQGIDYAEDNGITLIIALDCGIKSIDKIEYATQKGIDFVICDHHLPGDDVPNAVAVLDPKQKNCNYPFKELCGCGVGFKLIQALAANRGETIEDLIPYLDLVATAIAADIVPIVDENRILAYFGLQVINSNPRPGILAMKKQFAIKEFTITDVVFKIAPRINAAGRINHGKYAVRLLTEFNLDEAIECAKEIDEFNQSRRVLDQQITEDALQQITENNEEQASSSVVYHESWHKGVIGIVASRLIETYYRPTLVFTKSGDYLAASARSVKGFDVYEALEKCSEHIVQFGGHMYAAGLTIKVSEYENFKAKFEEVVKSSITIEQKSEEIEIDAIVDFNEFDEKTLRILKQFEPHGPGNMTPVFFTSNVFDTGNAQCIGKNNEHLRMFVKQNHTQAFPAIAFKKGDMIDAIRNLKLMNMVYSLSENHWKDKIFVQLQLKDIKTQ